VASSLFLALDVSVILNDFGDRFSDFFDLGSEGRVGVLDGGNIVIEVLGKIGYEGFKFLLNLNKFLERALSNFILWEIDFLCTMLDKVVGELTFLN